MFEFPFEVLAIVTTLALVVEGTVSALVTPIYDRYKIDKFTLMYIAWVLAAVFVWFAEANLFPGVFPNPIFGKVLTMMACGRGANIFHDLMDRAGMTNGTE